jgi:hypothetical protein
MARSFEFSVLRLVPDLARGEAVNIGIVVFLDDGVDVRIGEVLTRARLLYPAATPNLLREAVEVVRRLGAATISATDRHASLLQVGMFALGSLGYFTVEDDRPETYEAHLARLLRLFTATTRATESRTRPASRLNTAIRQELRKERVLAAVGDAGAISDHMIVPDWPIPTRPSLHADLALRNSVMRVCQIVDLSLSDDGPPPPALFEGVVTLDVAQREADAKETFLAYRASGPSARIDEALGIARLHASHLVDWDVKKERDDFLSEWILAAKGPKDLRPLR